MMVAKIKPGLDAEINFISGEKYNTEVSFISSAADTRTRTFRVEAELENTDLNIKDGLTGELIIYTEPVKAHFIPTSAFLLGDQGNVALATVLNDVVQIMDVQILIDTVQGAWITGIPDETNVIIGGQGFVKDGDEVISKTGPLPVHMLGNMWGQSWSNIYDLVYEEKPDSKYIDVTKIINEKSLSEIEMVEYAEDFFISMGFKPLPKTFWERSLFVET